MDPIFIRVFSDMSGLKANVPEGSGPRLLQGPRLPPPAAKLAWKAADTVAPVKQQCTEGWCHSRQCLC